MSIDELKKYNQQQTDNKKWKQYALDKNIPVVQDYACPHCKNDDIEGFKILGTYDYKEFNRDFWGHEWMEIALCPECSNLFQYQNSDI